MENRYVVMPKFSIQPNKLVSYSEVLRPVKNEDGSSNLYLPRGGGGVKKSFHNFRISDNAYRNLKNKINWLYYLAKARYKKTYNGKEITNFKMCFLTLTLPSKQVHPTSFITKNIFNQFLTEIRQRTQMQNYVWRLEFQKNGNAHYHLVTDNYLDFFFARKIWNRILSNYGYVQPYTEKFKGLSLAQYNTLVNTLGKTDFSVIAKRYAKGCQEKWKNPNSVDVKSVTSGKAISFYISKYFGKNEEEAVNHNPLDNEDNSKSMRLWFCTRSLSKLKSISDYCEAVPYDIFQMVKSVSDYKERFFDYCTVIYFELKKEAHKFRIFIEKMLRDYAKKQGYMPAI